MLRGSGNEADAGDFGALPPVVLANFTGVDAPFDQGVADAQRGQEIVGFSRQLQYRLVIEVVVMVVRQDHRFDRRQLVDADRRLVKTFWTGPLHGRGTLGEDRVSDPEFVAHFQQQGRVAEAVNAVIRCCQQVFTGQRLHRDRGGRSGIARLVENHVPHDPQHLAPTFALHRRMVTEQPLILARGFRRGSLIRRKIWIGHD